MGRWYRDRNERPEQTEKQVQKDIAACKKQGGRVVAATEGQNTASVPLQPRVVTASKVVDEAKRGEHVHGGSCLTQENDGTQRGAATTFCTLERSS